MTTELAAGQAVLDLFEQRDGEWLGRLRAELRRLYFTRKVEWPATWGEAYVTADDARALMRQYRSLRPPEGTSNNSLGALFRGKGWRRVGDHFSNTQGSHGNRIGRWAVVEDDAE